MRRITVSPPNRSDPNTRISMKRGRDTDADAASATKKSAASTSADAGERGFPSLPPPVLSHVWSYAVRMDVSDGVCDNAEYQLLESNVHELQLVCRSWRENMQQLLTERLATVAVVDVAAAAKKKQEEDGDSEVPLVLKLTPKDPSKPVTDVRVLMGEMFSGPDFNDRGFWTDDEQALVAVRMERDQIFHKTQPEIDWEATLTPFASTITRLDLSRMLLYTKQLGDLLRAAGKLCPNMKALILPPLEKRYWKKEDVRKDNMKALSEAMKLWFEASGGLTHLRVPYVGMDLVGMVQYVSDLAKYCPNLEHLDGWRFTFIEQINHEIVTCDEYIAGAPELWGTFWENSNKLKSFNTVVLPFQEAYYLELAETPKPELEELTISFNSLISFPTSAMDSELFCDVIAAFPSLKDLTIVSGEAPDEEEWTASEAFDDDFFVAVVEKCTKLEKLNVRCFADLEKVTMTSLRALMTVKTLSSLSFRSILDLDESFLGLLDDRIQSKSPLRMSLMVMRIGDMIWKVLQHIAKMKTEQFKGVSLSLSLKTHEAFGFVTVKTDKENGRLHEAAAVKKLYEEIKRIHGSTVRVHLHTTLPSKDHDSRCVLFDSLELSINDSQGFVCSRQKFTECGNEEIEQELCGEDVRADGVFEREPEGALEDLRYIIEHTRPRRIHIPGMSDDEDGMGGGEDDDDDQGEFGDGFFGYDVDDNDEGVEESDDDDEEGEDDDDDDEDDDEEGDE